MVEGATDVTPNNYEGEKSEHKNFVKLRNHRRNLSRRKYHVHLGQGVVVVGIMHQSSRSCAHKRERKANKIFDKIFRQVAFPFPIETP